MVCLKDGARLSAEQLQKAGQALYGLRWQSALARALGVDSSRIRGVILGIRRSPPGWTPEILELLEERARLCQTAQTELKSEIILENEAA